MCDLRLGLNLEFITAWLHDQRIDFISKFDSVQLKPGVDLVKKIILVKFTSPKSYTYVAWGGLYHISTIYIYIYNFIIKL